MPRAYGGLGADFTTYVMVAAEIGRHCGATALSYNMHVSSCMWSGFIADALEMSPQQRADHDKHRALHYARIVDQGKVYSQPFSEGGAAAAGKAPFGTLAMPAQHGGKSGYVVNGKKIFASLSGAADYYACCAHWTVPPLAAHAARLLYLRWGRRHGVTSSRMGPLGMLVTSAAADLQVRVRRDHNVCCRVYFQPRALSAMFATLSPTYRASRRRPHFTVPCVRGARLPKCCGAFPTNQVLLPR